METKELCSGLIIAKRIPEMKNEAEKHCCGPRRCNPGLVEVQPT